MFVIEFALCLSLNECIAPIVDKPRSRHETYEACMQVAYYKALELYMMNERPNLTVTYNCVPEIIGVEV
jgi:hypothetical protein